MNVRELISPIFKKNYSLGETEAALKQTKLVNYIFTGAMNIIRSDVFATQHQESHGTLGQHFLKDIGNGMSCACSNLVGLNLNVVFVLQVVLQITPLRVLAMTDKHSW